MSPENTRDHAYDTSFKRIFMIQIKLLTALYSSVILVPLVSAEIAHAQAPSLPPETMQAPGASSANSDHTPAPMPPALPPIIHYEAINPGETFGGGDNLAEPRKIAAAVVAQDNPSPHKIVDVGSFTGEFLEAFLQEFPAARGQWTEPVDRNEVNAKRRFARFGDRVDYVIGCPSRDISQGCVPKDVDVLITSWVTHHQGPDGLARFYKNAAALLPSGGWLVNLDNVEADAAWERRFKTARLNFQTVIEGPPMHGQHSIATLEQHIDDLHAAGLDDVAVVWKSFDTVLIMARKK
jgi:hypothetical protein